MPNVDLEYLGARGAVFLGPAAYSNLGWTVSPAGDLNGDGISDIAFSRLSLEKGGPGGVYVLYGGADFSSLNLSALQPSDGFYVQADVNDVLAGETLASAGDVNGDGIDDLLIGAPRNDDGGYNAGQIYVVFGKRGERGMVDLNNLSAEDGFVIGYQGRDSWAGTTVSSAGDINNDGIDDIVVGTSAGEAFVLFGKATGFGDVQLNSLAAADGFRIFGAVGNFVGTSVASAGDFNRDGIDDLLVNVIDPGRAYLILGRDSGFGNVDLANFSAADGFVIEVADSQSVFTVAGVGDVNGDGFDDVAVRQGGSGVFYVVFGRAGGAGTIDATVLDGSEGFAVVGAASESFGFNIAPAGDVNGDGFADLIVSAETSSYGASNAGSAYVLYGKAGGFATLNIASMTEADGFRIDGEDSNDRAGRGVSSAGDVNNDGFDDLLIGAPNRHESGYAAGAVYVVFGLAPTEAVTRTGTGAGQRLAGGELNDVLDGGGGDDHLIGNGGDDRLIGGEGDDLLEGRAGADLLFLQHGGSDSALGGVGDDGFYMGAALDALDDLDGGAGYDQLGLQGNYAGYEFSENNLLNTEMIVLMSGADTRFGDPGGSLYSYDLTMIDANVAAGQQLYLSFNMLQAGENVTFDGSAETDGHFRTSGGLGTDVLTGGAQSDGFYFGTEGRWSAGDKVDGGPGGSLDQLGLHGLYAGAAAISFGADQLAGIEMIVLLTGDDTRFGSGGLGYSYDITMHDDNVAAGGTMYVSANTLRADETLTFDGSAELDGHFTVYGGEAADTITGGAGADRLSGRGGADMLRGGGGEDLFLYADAGHSAPGARDTILDFASGDRIDLSRIDAIAGGGDDAFTFVGAAAFTGTAGELRAVQNGGDWVVEADIDGDGAADLSILVTRSDAAEMLAGDFVL